MQVAKLLKEHNLSLISKKHDSTEETKIVSNKDERAVLESYYKVGSVAVLH